MGASSFTPNIELPQFSGTDKPTWRGDVNGAFNSIDQYAGNNTAEVNDIVANIDKLQNEVDVEIESFVGASDDVKFSNAIASLATTGGKIRLRPGKTYVFTAAATTFDFSVYHKQITIQAWNANIVGNFNGAVWTVKGNTGQSEGNTLVWLGGTVRNNVGDGIALYDVGKAFFFRVTVDCPNGSGWVQANVVGFSENNHYLECYDLSSTHAISFLNLGSPSGSMARTVIRTLRMQGGVAGQAKLNIGDNTALYGALIDGLSGNLVDQAIVMRIAGNMHGCTIQGNLHFEVSTTGNAYYFTVGTIAGGQRATLISPVNVNQTMTIMAPGSSTPYLYNVLYLGAKVLGVSDVLSAQMLNTDPAIDVPATTPTNVFTINIPNAGEYQLTAGVCVRTFDVNTANIVQANIIQGTADIHNNIGVSAVQFNVAADASADKQVCSPVLSAYLTIYTPGTIFVNVRTSVHSQVVGKTPISNYGGSSGWVLEQKV